MKKKKEQPIIKIKCRLCTTEIHGKDRNYVNTAFAHHYLSHLPIDEKKKLDERTTDSH